MTTTVADLAARLGLKVDVAAFSAGDAWIGRIKQGLAGIAAWASYNWAKHQIEQTVELGSELADLAQKVGIPAEALQELGYAADQSGSSMEGLSFGLGRLAKLASDAKKGGGEAAKTFHDLGVKFQEADGSLRPAEDLLGDIADHIKSLPDGTEKTALAMRVFGRSGKDLIPLLNEGGDGIGKLRQEFIDLGGEITGETADALESFGDNMSTAGKLLGFVRNQIVIGLLPYLKEAVQGFIAWWKANRIIIRQRIDRVIAALVPIFKLLVRLVGVFMTLLDASINLVSNWARILVQLWDQYSVALGAALGVMLAFKSASIAAAIASAAAWAAPLAAIAAILLLGEDIWVWAQGGDSVVGDIYKGLKDLFVNAIEFWATALNGFFTDFWEMIDETAKKFRDIIPEGVQEFLGIDDRGLSIRAQERKAERYQQQFGGTIEDARMAVYPNAPAGYTGSPSGVAVPPVAGAAQPVTINAPITLNLQNLSPGFVYSEVEDHMKKIIRTAHAAATAGR